MMVCQNFKAQKRKEYEKAYLKTISNHKLTITLLPDNTNTN